MRLGIIADVHGNDVALQAALDDAAADAARRVDLVERYGLMAAGIGWTRGVLTQAGLLGTLTGRPSQLRLDRPDGTRVLGRARVAGRGRRSRDLARTPSSSRPSSPAPARRDANLTTAEAGTRGVSNQVAYGHQRSLYSSSSSATSTQPSRS
jgi:hypothetical protein